ncbi:MAG: hypothetical protein ACOX42_01930 [Clostridia bacterium]|jgi:hypothetical protein
MYIYAGIQRAVAGIFPVTDFSYRDKDALFKTLIYENPEKAHLYC